MQHHNTDQVKRIATGSPDFAYYAQETTRLRSAFMASLIVIACQAVKMFTVNMLKPVMFSIENIVMQRSIK